MRLFYTLILSLCWLSSSHAQYFWQESFEYPEDDYRNHFFFDTTHLNNIWQIGSPHKIVFDSGSAVSVPNVIITDTLNPYPPNDTSIFTVTQYFVPFASNVMSINFYYQLNIDSGTTAKMEISGDNGVNWINPITEDTTYLFYWGGSKPRLDTSTLGWTDYQLNIDTWAFAVPGGPDSFPHYRTSDTLLFRFTFISDSDTTSKDGWMMDNFYFENALMEGLVSKIQNNDIINVFPVPTAGPMYVHTVGGNPVNATITIYNLAGQKVFTTTSDESHTYLNLSLPTGVYYLKYETQNNYAVKKIVLL